MLAALKSRQEALEETLRQRLEELKKLCLREAVSTLSSSGVLIRARVFIKGKRGHHSGPKREAGPLLLMTPSPWDEHPSSWTIVKHSDSSESTSWQNSQ